MSDSLLVQLQHGVEVMNLTNNNLPLPSYISYIDLLTQWNQAYNLTAVREPEKMIAYHILDSLSILSFIDEGRFLDIGTGAGLPGIILALARPDTHWVLLDSNNKKTRFVNQAVLDLKLGNVEVVSCRIEEYDAENKFSAIVSRAFTSLETFYTCSHRLLERGGSLLAMKGPEPEQEISELVAEGVSTRIYPLDVPGVTGGRSLVKMVPEH